MIIYVGKSHLISYNSVQNHEKGKKQELKIINCVQASRHIWHNQLEDISTLASKSFQATP